MLHKVGDLQLSLARRIAAIMHGLLQAVSRHQQMAGKGSSVRSQLCRARVSASLHICSHATNDLVEILGEMRAPSSQLRGSSSPLFTLGQRDRPVHECCTAYFCSLSGPVAEYPKPVIIIRYPPCIKTPTT